MNDWRYESPARHDVVTIPLIWVALALSLLVHVAALWVLVPKLVHTLSERMDEIGKTQSALAVRLEPKPAPAPVSPSPPAQPPIVAQAAPPRAPSRPLAKPKPAPPVIALPKPEAEIALPKPAPQPAPTPPPEVAPKPIEGDLASYIEARRRARGEAPPSAAQPNNSQSGAGESDDERRNRIIAANLGLNQTRTFGYDPKSAGGIFQIEHLSYEYADFYFFGMNKEVGRNTKQLIEVKRGNEADIKIAVIRKMIAIIRDNVTGDFVWLSRRGPVTMSARLGDNGELETFMLHDIFPDERPQR